MNSGIYKITNIINKKFYIGSAVDFKRRKTKHLYTLKHDQGVNRILQNAWNKYGENSFMFELIEEVLDKSKLIEREQHYLDALKPVYNTCPKADSHLGAKYKLKNKRSAEHCKKISINAKARLKDPTRNSMYGKKHSKESIELMRKNKGPSDGKNNAFYGKKHSKSTLLKMSLAKKGKRSSRAKFSDDEVRQIRIFFNIYQRYDLLAETYGISISGARKIIAKVRYADVD